MALRKQSYEHLLSPGTIGPLNLRNRIVMPAMDQNLCSSDGELTESRIAHYEERAAGGVGLLILETSAVAYPVGASCRHQPSVATDQCIPGLTALADRVHVHGAAVIVQMCHHGKTALIDIADERELMIPSLPLPDLNPAGMAADLTYDEMMKMASTLGGRSPRYHEATTDDLAWVVDQFAAAAARV